MTGDLYKGENPGLAILISAGTGFPRYFYRHVARYLAGRGAIVLAYDYRGIGDSARGSLKNSPIEYADWGRFDLSAAITALRERVPGLKITHLAHSVGGHFIGLADNHDAISRHAFICVGSGYWGHHQRRYIPAAMLFWWGIGTYCLFRFGYIRPTLAWRGAPLPPKVFRDWRRWAHKPDYHKGDMVKFNSPNCFADIRSPIRSWLYSDDPIATPRAEKTILSIYPNAQTETVLSTPAEFKLERIGHDGAFRKGRQALWEEWWEWLHA